MSLTQEFMLALWEGQEQEDDERFHLREIQQSMDENGPRTRRYRPVGVYPSPGRGVSGESSN